MRDLLNRPAIEAASQFRRLILDNPSLYLDDFKAMARAMAGSNAKYHGEVIDWLYQPFFFDDQDRVEFEKICRLITGIAEKLMTAYLADTGLGQLYGFDRTADELIRIDPGYSHPAPMARLDLFFTRSAPSKFCEFNTDGTSGMNEIGELERVFLGTRIFRELEDRFTVQRYELVETWVDTLLALYREWGGRKEPVIAISDWEGEGVREEFEAFRAAMERRGLRCVITDPRHFSYSRSGTGGRLMLNGTQIDLVYRRAVNFECFDRAAEIRPLIEAYQNGDVCMAGPFRSQLLHNKNVFRVLRHPDVLSLFSPDEQALIRERIPQTYLLTEEAAVTRSAVRNREMWLIKPEDRYAAQEVIAGRDCTQEQWHRLLEEKERSGGYLLQEFCNQGEDRLLSCFDGPDGSFEEITCRNVIGMYMYNGNFSGVYTRVGTTSIIASLWHCFMLPGLFVDLRTDRFI
jgi:hypothetical protein